MPQCLGIPTSIVSGLYLCQAFVHQISNKLMRIMTQPIKRHSINLDSLVQNGHHPSAVLTLALFIFRLYELSTACLGCC